MSRPPTTKPPRGSSKTPVTAREPAESAEAEELRDGWERFWFTPEPVRSLRSVRVGLSIVAALYFVSHWGDIGFWFGSDGPLATEQLGRLIASTEAAGAGRWHLTPLYWIESTLGLRMVLVAGIVASLLTAAGIGRRWTTAIAWLILLSVATRCWMIAGLVEIPLAFGLASLVIAGTHGSRGEADNDDGRTWTAGLARRLLEIHVSALVAATALTQLAGEPWWNGEGALRLVLPIDGPAFEWAALGRSPLATAVLTHAIVWIPIAAVPLLWLSPTGRESMEGTANPPRARRWAAWLLILHAAMVGLLSGHMLYAVAIAVLLSLFLVPHQADADKGNL